LPPGTHAESRSVSAAASAWETRLKDCLQLVGRPTATLLKLLPEPWLHGNTLAPLGATARKHCPAALGLHSRAKTVRLGPAAAVRLKRALGH
jgi:hypothetical protein